MEGKRMLVMFAPKVVKKKHPAMTSVNCIRISLLKKQ
jgi:hypothetical protein